MARAQNIKFQMKSALNQMAYYMENRPEARAEYQQIIRDTFAAKGKELRENLDHPYYCRGSHRQHLIEQGLPYAFDRTAVMMVSLESHFRSGVLVQNYLAK